MTAKIEYEPGERVPVQVVANSNGDIPKVGEGVAIVGEDEDMRQVERVSAAGEADLVMFTDPLQHAIAEARAVNDPLPTAADYSAGDIVGRATGISGSGLELWLPFADDFDPSTNKSNETPTIGDIVEYGANGTLVADAGNAPLPFAQVVGLGGQDFFEAGLVQVRLYR